MWVSIDLCIVPLGISSSLAPYIAICQKIIEAKGLEYELGPNGTAIEGDWEDVFVCVKECHKALHNSGVERIYTTLKLNTRQNRQQSFREKVSKVQAALKAKGE